MGINVSLLKFNWIPLIKLRNRYYFFKAIVMLEDNHSVFIFDASDVNCYDFILCYSVAK